MQRRRRRWPTLRRLLYCGEWISSHALHIYMLHAPDFLGYPDVIALARDHRDLVERGLRLKKAGNAMLEAVGGRAIHPVNVRVGGFYRRARAGRSGPAGRAAARRRSATGAGDRRLGGRLRLPRRGTWITSCWPCTSPGRYAIERGEVRVRQRAGLPGRRVRRHVAEHQVPHSTALHARLDGRGYLTGPLARYTINSAQLSPGRPPGRGRGRPRRPRAATRSAASWSARSRPSTPSRRRCGSSTSYERPEPSRLSRCRRVAGVGHGVSEAPRGLLYHRYRARR